MTLIKKCIILHLIIDIERTVIMGLYGDKKDYEQLVKENIKKAKLLYSLSDEDRILVNEYLNEKEKIKEENGFLANYKLRKIDKKIEKIQNKYKQK